VKISHSRANGKSCSPGKTGALRRAGLQRMVTVQPATLCGPERFSPVTVATGGMASLDCGIARARREGFRRGPRTHDRYLPSSTPQPLPVFDLLFCVFTRAVIIRGVTDGRVSDRIEVWARKRVGSAISSIYGTCRSDPWNHEGNMFAGETENTGPGWKAVLYCVRPVHAGCQDSSGPGVPILFVPRTVFGQLIASTRSRLFRV